jgi:DNA repair exonuclease SbcCD nuclease subunit
MKIVNVADLHLNKSSYTDDNVYTFTSVPFRPLDFMKSFEYIVDLSIEKIKPDLFCINGDIYDSYNPPNDVTGFFSRQMNKLSLAKIPVIILVGNHDICSKNHALQALKELDIKSMKIIDTPTSLKFKDVFLMLFPYSVDIEKRIVTIKDQFDKFLEESKEKINNDTSLHGLPIIFMGHFGVNGAYINKYKNNKGEDKKFINSANDGISLIDLDKIGAKYVFLGDYHKHQVLGTKKCISMYSGSIERTDMSEANDEKGFVLYDSKLESIDLYGECRFIKYPYARPMIKISGSLSEIHKKIDFIDAKSNHGAIVQLEFIGTRSEHIDFDNAQSEILNRLKEKISPICIRRENVILDPEMVRQSELVEKEIKECGSVNNVTVINVVKEMIAEREPNEEERNILVNIAEEIYKNYSLINAPVRTVGQNTTGGL